MTVIAWVLVAGIAISLILCLTAIVKAWKERFTGKWIALFVLGLGGLFLIYLGYNLNEIEPADQAIIMLTAGLVAVTGLYAFSAARQASASVKLAEETREQRIAMYRPHIVLEKRDSVRGKYFMKDIHVGFGNEQGGTAINVELHISHPVFKFQTYPYPSSLSVRDQPQTHDFSVMKPSVEDDPGIPVSPLTLVVANYEDVSGNPWHSTLELRWDATSKDITPGRMQVAIPVHLEVKQ